MVECSCFVFFLIYYIYFLSSNGNQILGLIRRNITYKENKANHESFRVVWYCNFKW